MSAEPEYWLRGPVESIPALLQPVAHALLQARAEINESVKQLPPVLLWEKPFGLASPGFHLQHLRGVLARLFTYAADQVLSDNQLIELKSEGIPYAGNDTIEGLLTAFNSQVDNTLEILRNTDPGSLGDTRGVGRAKIPSTVIGLYFHAAEHTMRHTGQLIVTVKVLVENSEKTK